MKVSIQNGHSSSEIYPGRQARLIKAVPTTGNIPAFFLLFCLFLLNGCAVGPDFQKPEAQVADEWVSSADPHVINREAADYGNWWTVFGDPILDKLVDTAYRQNLPLQVAGVRILEARANLGIAIGEQFPQGQQAVGSLIYNELSSNAPNARFADKNFWDFNLGFDAAWELDFWGRFRRGVESASASMGASITNYDDILVSLTAEVARTYVVIRTLEELIAVTRHNIEIQQRSFEIADVQFRNGAVSELDPQQALSLLRDTQSLLPPLQASLSQAKYALSILLGLPPSNLQAILGDKPGPIPRAPDEVAIGIPADLLRRRPDVRFAELQAAAQSARIGIAKADLFPRISLVGSLGFQTSESSGFLSNSTHLSKIFSSKSFTYFIGPDVQWNILNYGRIKNNVRVQDARLEELIVNYQNTVLKAAKEVEDSLAGFLGAQRQVVFLDDGVEAAERAVELAGIQYREGAVDYTRVLNTEQSLIQQQTTWIQARGGIATNLIAIYKALGGGWELRKGKEFVPAHLQKEMSERTDWGEFFDKPQADLPDDLPEPPPTGTEQPLINKPMSVW
jgi:NodT family efflux transporter outer membrane factor (OMF) lipoprotein